MEIGNYNKSKMFCIAKEICDISKEGTNLVFGENV